MKMVFPNIAYKSKAIEFINEFLVYGSEIHGSGGLDRFLREATYEEWLEKVIRDIDIANISEPRVPALTYFYVREDDDKIIGMINIRLSLNDFLAREGGHIGYSVRPTERKRHYATSMLKHTLPVCKMIGIEDVIITCNKSNIASANVVRNCGGKLDEEFFSDTYGEIIQRYVIKLEAN